MDCNQKLFRRFGAVGVAILGLSGGNLSPASAHVNTLGATPYNDGHGSFVATSYPNLQGCADYSNYVATLTFEHETAGPATATVSSTPGAVWGEFADGTYANTGGVPANVPCSGSGTAHGGGGDAIGGFTGTLVLASGTVCTLGDGTYTRGHFGNNLDNTTVPAVTPPYNHPELNIAYQFASVTKAGGLSTCPDAPLILKTTIQHVEVPPPGLPPFFSPYQTACNSPIAPQTCVLDHQENTTEW